MLRMFVSAWRFRTSFPARHPFPSHDSFDLLGARKHSRLLILHNSEFLIKIDFRFIFPKEGGAKQWVDDEESILSLHVLRLPSFSSTPHHSKREKIRSQFVYFRNKSKLHRRQASNSPATKTKFIAVSWKAYKLTRKVRSRRQLFSVLHDEKWKTFHQRLISWRFPFIAHAIAPHFQMFKISAEGISLSTTISSIISILKQASHRSDSWREHFSRQRFLIQPHNPSKKRNRKLKFFSVRETIQLIPFVSSSLRGFIWLHFSTRALFDETMLERRNVGVHEQ